MLLIANRALLDSTGGEVITITTDQTILGVVGIKLIFTTGTLTVNWGDGNPSENFTSGIELTHNYISTGTYDIEISGDLVEITSFDIDTSRVSLIENIITGLLTELDISSNLYNGTLDLSNISIGTTLKAQSNTSLSIIFSSSGNTLLTLNNVSFN